MKENMDKEEMHRLVEAIYEKYKDMPHEAEWAWGTLKNILDDPIWHRW